MLVVGDKEIESNAVAVRSRKEGDIGQINADEFLARMKKEIANKERQYKKLLQDNREK